MVLRDIFTRNAASLDADQAADPVLLNDLVMQIDSAARDYKKLREYWDGQHPVKLTVRLRQFLTLNGITATEFSDNFMGVVVSAATDRLDVSAFTVPGEAVAEDAEPDEVGPVAQFANDTWAINRVDAMQKDVYGTAMALGDAYVIGEWDETLKAITLNFNPPEMVRVWYDDADYLQPVLAVKKWITTSMDVTQHAKQLTRLNLYYENRIEKYMSTGTGGGAWQRFVDTLGGVWPIPWLDAAGDPLGIPVAHFRNNPRGASYGRSDLLDVIPIQDSVNKALVDGLRVMDAQGWPQRWVTGLDDTPVGDVASNPGTLLHAGSKDAKFGEFDAADPTGIIAWMEHLAATVATLSKSPQHLFRITGDAPSGEALKTAEAPFVRRVQDRQTVFGNAWEDVMGLAVRIANANGVALTLPDTGFTTEWEDAETSPSELERVQSINEKQGISNRQRLREYGYTDEEITRIMDELEQEPNDIADALARAFDRGEGAGGGAAAAGGQNA